MEKFLEITIREFLNEENLNFENISPIVYDLCKILKKKKLTLSIKKVEDLISDAVIINILDKYKSQSSSIDLMSESDDETPAVIKEKFDERLKLLDIDIALLDYSTDIIKGNVKKFYKPYLKWGCCKKIN
jgi:hypothetical protein